MAACRRNISGDNGNQRSESIISANESAGGIINLLMA
jgi:hypothetical protein